MGSDQSSMPSEKAPCGALLDAYVACMEKHKNVAPDPYEPEWCSEQKSLYRACRDELKSTGNVASR